MSVSKSRSNHHRMRSAARILVLIIFLGGFCLPASPHRAVAAPDDPATADATIASALQLLKDHPSLRGLIANSDEYLIGGGYLYWAQCNPVINVAGEPLGDATTAAVSGYLRRWPLSGGIVATISSQAFCTLNNAAADASGLYYYAEGRIYRRSVAEPMTAVIVEPTPLGTGPNSLIVDGDYVYWISNEAALYRIPKSATWISAPFYLSPLEYLGDAATSPHSLAVGGSRLYWYGGGRVFSRDKNCVNSFFNTCPRSELAVEYATRISGLQVSTAGLGSTTTPLWLTDDRDGSSFPGPTIRGNRCGFGVIGFECNVGTVYTAPSHSGGRGTISQLASDGTYLFWVENIKIYMPPSGIFGGYWRSTDQGLLMKWKMAGGFIDPDPFISPQPIVSNFGINGVPRPFVGGNWVYFQTSNGLARIGTGAAPLSWDLALDALEVTQGIQSLENDVPLVNGKSTYVRVYGHLEAGTSVSGVGALLEGRNSAGAALPGSPLRPITGARNLPAGKKTFDRTVFDDGWLFRLPESWTQGGEVRLTARLEANSVRFDPKPANNALAPLNRTFVRKAPICIVGVPVRTNWPRVSTSEPNFQFAVDMSRRLLPTSDIWVYHQNEDIAELEARFGIPPWRYGPYEMADDSWKVMLSLWTRDQFSDDPDACDRARARTHYVGMVHPDAGGANGSGRLGGDQLWFRPPPADFSRDFRSDRAATLAHELGHNYGRRHVNCPDGRPEDTSFYPYPPCALDNEDGVVYLGFNYATSEVITRTAAGDLMSYANPRWISDFSWRGILNEIPNAAGVAGVAEAPTVQAPSNAPNLAAAGAIVWVGGGVTPSANQGELGYAYVFPAQALSPGMLTKWQAVAAPAVAAGTLQADVFTVRLRDAAGAVLATHAVTLANDLDDLDDPTQAFTLAFPAPDGQVARIELLAGAAVIATREVGSGAPTVEVITPAGGTTIDDTMTLAWRATDPDAGDRLLFTVQYSPDNGQTWRVLLSDFPNRSGTDTVTLDLNDLSGIPASTTGGLIRVAASDGYNTTLATSQAFTVVNRAPEPHIHSPGSAALPAGQPVELTGSANDAEDGGLSGEALQWELDGNPIGDGQSQTIAGLAPGTYTLTLTATDSAGKAGTATSTFTITPLEIPNGATAPMLDGICEDAYAGATPLPIKPYSDGRQATALIVRSNDALWACFSGMARTGGTSPRSLAVLRIDADYSRDTQPQVGDYVFVLGEDGVLTTYNGTNIVTGLGTEGGLSAGDTDWSAEIRIPAELIGGWDKVVGLAVESAWINAVGNDYAWPHATAWNNPATWATAAPGTLPQITALEPARAAVGSGATVVTIQGSGFAANAVARLDDLVLATTVISSTELRATIPTAQLRAAQTMALTVANAGLEATPSAAQTFSVTNPLPAISQATLAGSTLTISGQRFVSGATVQFNGTTYYATGNNAQLQATISAADRIAGADASVAVFNPGPGGGLSNVVELGASAAPGSNRIYLPVVRR